MFGKKKSNESKDVEKVTTETKVDEVVSLPPVSIAKIYSFATPMDILITLTAAICAILNGVAQPLMTLVFSGVIGLFSEFSQNSLKDPVQAKITLQEEINWLCVQFVIIGVITLFTSYGQLSLWMVSGERQAVRIRHRYYHSILSQEMGWFDSNQSGDISSRIAGDVNLVQDGISDKVGLFIQYVATFLAGFILAFIKGWKLTLVLLSVVPILIGCGAFIAKLIASGSADGQGAYGQAGSVAEEVLSAIRTVYAFGGQPKEQARYETKLEIARKSGHRKAIITGVGVGTIITVLFFSYGLGMWYGGKLIAEEGYNPDEVLAVFFSVLIGAMSIGQASPSLTALATAQGAAAKLFDVIDRQSKIDPFQVTEAMQQTQQSMGQIKGRITFKDIKFSYPSRPDVPILKGINLDVEPGTTVALVGASGSGKSTTVGLIERFYDPESGQVLLDGVNVKDISIKFLREHIGIVGQEPILFATTIKQNILYGLKDDAEINYDSPELQRRVEDACKLSNIHEFIMTLPQRYDTMVGEKGSLLSGGQKQRIAIARALIKNPQILLLDEATSALDTESEKLVQQALDNASKDRTTIVIAHRLSTIKDSNKIVVFDKGLIIEEGTHDELINLDGAYNQLVQKQALRTEARNDSEDSLVLTKEKELKRIPTIKEVVGIDVEDKNDLFIAHNRTLSKADSLKLVAQIKEEKFAKEPVPMLRVLKMASPWTLMILIGLIGAMIDGAIFPIYSVILTNVTQAFIEIKTPGYESTGVENVNYWSLMFVVLGIVSFVAINARIGCMEHVGESLTYVIRKQSFEALLRQEIAYYDDPLNSVGVLAAKLSTEAEQIQGLISKVLGPIFMAISTACVGLGLAFKGGWKLTLVVLATIPVIALANLLQMRVLTALNRQTKKAYEQVSAIASESIVNVRTVAGLTREEIFYQDYVSRVDKAHNSAVSGSIKAAFGYSLAMGSPFLVNALAFWYGTTLVVAGEYDFMEMFQVITAVLFTGMALGQSSAQLTTYVKSKVAAIDLFELLDREPSINNGDVGDKNQKVIGNLDFKGAHFAYPSRSDIPILQGLDLSVMAGKRVALVGSSGSGKSTIIALAQRFYDLARGQLDVEGTPIKQWNVPHLRSEMALVGQEPVLFDLTIAENIAYGRPGASREDIEAVAKMANAHNFIMDQPDGYDTRVGERGGQLSGGQKQRVAIARALIRNPKLLLLDEATSALDSESEKVVQDALDKASQGRTTITIAHRLSTVQDSDLIVVMRSGKVVETGTHDSLLELKGFYYALVNQQQLGATN